MKNIILILILPVVLFSSEQKLQVIDVEMGDDYWKMKTDIEYKKCMKCHNSKISKFKLYNGDKFSMDKLKSFKRKNLYDMIKLYKNTNYEKYDNGKIMSKSVKNLSEKEIYDITWKIKNQ